MPYLIFLYISNQYAILASQMLVIYENQYHCISTCYT